MTTLHRQPMRLALRTLAGLLVVIFALPALAVAQAFTLRVALHDAGGRPVAGVTVRVRSEEGVELAHQLTSTAGTAVFVDLPAVVRVTVAGQPRGGLPLFQLGDDAAGVRLDLGQAADAPRLDLRVERDGLVLPDPATMITREEGGPVVGSAPPIPTAALATPAPLTTAPVGSSLPVVSDAEPVAARPSSPAWVPWITVLIIAFAAGVLRLVQRRRNAQ